MKKINCCRLQQVVNIGIQNCANNKEFQLKLNFYLLFLFFMQVFKI